MISVHEAEKLSLQQIEKFLLAAKEVRFEASQREEVYGWIERLLCQQEYAQQGRKTRGLLRRYIGKMTGLSQATGGPHKPGCPIRATSASGDFCFPFFDPVAWWEAIPQPTP